jgi:serine/threonine-protein kinase
MSSSPAPGERLPSGHLLGARYRIERVIGSGGMGTVYAASAVDTQRAVALKVIGDEHTHDPNVIARFQREGRLMAEIRHANIVDVLELGQLDGHWFIAMELLAGSNLEDAIAAHGPYAPRDAAPIIEAVLDALDAAHGHQVVHRDLKPANVFLADGARVKVLDFGVAKVVGQSAQEQLTRSGTVLGTPEYMAPEQAMGTSVDARSDLYAVGCILYAMLCGRPPFVDGWPMRVVMKQAFEAPAPPSRLRPGLPDAVDRFIARALEKKPDDRFQSAGEMREALAALRSQ